ncbi:MAG: VWA domain-containing protein [Candidatus Cloacimonetes bacterium]|nr:VWA domain-containing protein [Candidatus Cloacimonadota bacterium]
MIRALGDVVNWLESQSPENLESDIPKLSIRFTEETDLSEEQIVLLKEMIKMFERYHDSKISLQYLMGILQLLSNPDAEILIPLSQRGIGKSLFMFNENVFVKEIVKRVMGMVRNRDNIKKTSPNNLPKYRTIVKNKFFKQEEDKAKFSVDVTDLQKVRMNFAKREKTKHMVRGKNDLSLEKGRVIGFSKEQSGNIALTPTIFNAIQNGNYSLKEKKINIQTKNFLYPKYEENMDYNIMLILDTSKSISWVIPHIEKLISQITSNVSNSRDKLGLITFNNDLAQIYHYPTLNVRQVIGTINKLEAKGQTPLGEALNLALQVLSKEQYKLPGMKNLLLLISDCFPEPLEGGHKNLLDEPAYKSVIFASEKIRYKKFGFIIINPAVKEEKKINWNKKLIDKIIDITKAKYIEFHPKIKFNLLKGDKAFIDNIKLTELTNIVNEVKLKR